MSSHYSFKIYLDGCSSYYDSARQGVKYLQQSDESSLANKVFTEQKRLKLPGLVKEAEEIAKEWKILEDLEDNSINLATFKRTCKERGMTENGNSLKSDIKKYSKLEELKHEEFGTKEYLKELNVEQIRTKFRHRTRMTKIKLNFKNEKQNSVDNWLCNSCERAVESNSHILWCPAYAKLRVGKNLQSDSDLTSYISQVLKIRAELKLRR